VVLIIALWLDLSGSQTGNKLQFNGISIITPTESNPLNTCDLTQASFSGPLVPDPTTASSENRLSEISPGQTVPESAWSPRAGFSISAPTDPEHWAQMLGSGWYLDWNVQSEPSSTNLDHWQMIRVHEDCISPSIEAIQTIAARNTGEVWVIGNEPDVIWQDNITAIKYATTYHILYDSIKSADPTALIAVGGVSQATPIRLAYLDQVLEDYQNLFHESMPVDWWTVHGYVLREEKGSWGVDIPPGIDAIQGELREVDDHGRIDLFESQLRSFRQWMAENGYQHTPLALTEFGILMPSSYGFPEEMVARYLEQTFTWLSQVQDESSGYPSDGYHLVQRWAWFSVSDPTYVSSNLGDLSSGNLTIVGETFRDTVSFFLNP
jgi:hypothetical protein